MDPWDEIVAEQNLRDAGSVMARPQLPKWRTDSPLLDTVLTMVDTLVADPLGNVSGPAKAVFGPIARGSPVMGRIQKKVAKAIFRRDPETFKAVADSPRTMDIWPMAPSVQKEEGTAIARLLNASLGHYQPSPVYEYIAMTPTTLRGQLPSGITGANLPTTALHEAQHFLNQERLFNPLTMENPELKSKISLRNNMKLLDAITPRLSRGGKIQVKGELEKGAPTRALNEALSWLSEVGTSKYADPTTVAIYNALKVKPGGVEPPMSFETISPLLDQALKAKKPSKFKLDPLYDYINDFKAKLGV